MTDDRAATATPMTPDPSTVSDSRRDRQLIWYFGGLVTVYLLGLVAFWPWKGGPPAPLLFLVVMLAPTLGALAAAGLAQGRIRWGRPTWWILAGLGPTLGVLVAFLAGGALGWVTIKPGLASGALLSSPFLIGSACISAAGEEIGWRGFLWPLLRSRHGFWTTSAIVGVIWWLYHVPLILLGWYGSPSGLPAFSVAIAGFVLFVGAITDRSRSVWASILAHGAWNGLVATGFPAVMNGETIPSITGSPAVIGEFGWLAAVASLAVGVLTATWHVRSQRPQPASQPNSAP